MAMMYKDHNPRIVIGPHWPLYICCSVIILAFSGTIIVLLILHGSVFFTIGGFLMVFINMGSYTMTAVANPGIPDRNFSPSGPDDAKFLLKRNNLAYCRRCNLYYHTGTHTRHCEDCDICIEEYDHHCPWTGKCIGSGNVNYFYTFLCSTFLQIFYLMGSALYVVQK